MRENRAYDAAVEQRRWAGGPPESRTAGGAGLPLLTSKLAAAPLPGAVVPRTRLVRLLDSGAAGPVTLVTAPAGWGKTLLLSSWYRDRAGAGALAWVSVEPSDAGGQLWSYVCAAVDSAGEGSGPPLPAPGAPSHDEFLIHLAAALARRAEPVILVLDDFHRVDDPGVLSGLDFLLRHAGERLHLVIGSRTDPALPLHRWRLSGELAEVRVADLAFSTAESAALLAAHGVTLPAADVTELHARTEGWPAGLRLAALSLRDHPDPARFVGEFGGDHPGVADYLTGEVLAPLPADVHDALLRSSVAERIYGDLVDALTGRTDGEHLLQEVERGVGFLTALGTRPASYRWHRMLGDLLRAELRQRTSEDVLDLHRRAAAWHEAHGLPVDALRHALAGRAWDAAKTLLVDHWHDLVPSGDIRVDGPTGAPPPPEAVRVDPELALAYAADRLDLHDLDAAESYLQLAARHEHLLADERRQRFALMIAAFRLGQAQLGGDDDRKVLTRAEQLVALVRPAEPSTDAPGADEPAVDLGARAIARAALGSAQFAVGDLAAAEAELTGGMTDAERAGLSRPALACASRLAFVRAVRGQLRAAERAARGALARCRSRSGLADCAHAHLALAVVAMHRDRPEEAAANLALAAQSGAEGSGPIGALVELIRAQLLQDRGELTASYQALLAGRRHLTDQTPYLAHWFVAVEADLRTARGDLDTARELLLPLVENGAEPLNPLAVPLARAHLRADDPRGAARLVGGWEDRDGSWALPVRLEAGLLDALTARSLGDRRRAARALERVLQLAEPEGFRRVFSRGEPSTRDLLVGHLDSGTACWPLVSELIAASGNDVGPRENHARPPALGEPLTERELTILRYLQSILSNVEIATELSLSVNTVKTHVRNIYRKLDANRRREAVRRAREMHLL